MIALICTAFYLGTITLEVDKIPHTETRFVDEVKHIYHIDKNLDNELENWASFENSKGHKLTVTLKCKEKQNGAAK